ncbi:MAG TPA: hypothetical protein VNL74_08025 [Methylococcus sp.]|nr:hypothetical protein [Methylococcus sp.]
MTDLRKYDPELAALFVENYRGACRAARNLRVSIDRTASLFPLDGASLDQLDDDALESLDAFRVRYAQLQDMLANKLFRGLLRLEEESAGSMLDVLNAMEKRGIIRAFETWKTMRELRNTFMHDYPGEGPLRAEALTRAHAMAPELLDVLARLRDRATGHIGIPVGQLPEAPR